MRNIIAIGYLREELQRKARIRLGRRGLEAERARPASGGARPDDIWLSSKPGRIAVYRAGTYFGLQSRDVSRLYGRTGPESIPALRFLLFLFGGWEEDIIQDKAVAS